MSNRDLYDNPPGASVDTMAWMAHGEQSVSQLATPERLAKAAYSTSDGRAQRLAGPMLALQRAGDIQDSHVAAAERWYRDYVLGVEGARDPEAGHTGNAPDVHAAMLSRVAACTRHRNVQSALGWCGEIRLRLLLVDELSFSNIATKLMPKNVNGRKKIAAQMVFLLEQLVELYDQIDQARNRPSR